MTRQICSHCGKVRKRYARCPCGKHYCWKCVYSWRSTLLHSCTVAAEEYYLLDLCCMVTAEKYYLIHAPLEEFPPLMGVYEIELKGLDKIIKDRLAGRTYD